MSCWARACCWTRASGKCLWKTARTRMHYCNSTKRCGLESFSGYINNQTVNGNGECGFECFPVKLTSFYIPRNFQGRMNTFQSQGWNALHLYSPPKKIYLAQRKWHAWLRSEWVSVLETATLAVEGHSPWRCAYRTQSPPLQPPEGMPCFSQRLEAVAETHTFRMAPFIKTVVAG